MAEERLDGREVSWRKLLPWIELFRGFGVALDLNKLLLAAAGIVTMAFGWWFLSFLFSASEPGVPPTWDTWPDRNEAGWVTFRKARLNWNLMHEATNLAKSDAPQPPVYEVEDIAETKQEYELFKDLNKIKETKTGAALEQAFLDRVAKLQKDETISANEANSYRAKVRQYGRLGRIKPAGTLAVGPWFEDRGPNPYLLITGQAGIPWEPNHFWEWFVRDQVLVMIEPLVKFVRPIIYFLSPRGNNFTSRFYFLSVMLWTLVTWSFFGGAITRIAAVQIARGERIGLVEAMIFAGKRLLSYITAPLFPLAFIFIVLVFMAIFGLIGMIPYFGDVAISGLFWPLMLLFGLLMSVALVGLVGWPLMSATISTEGTDSWEAVSRAYSYVYQRPWHYLWYSMVAVGYGAIVVFFVGFMGSLTVYMAKWGVAQTPLIETAGREPSFLFIYAPTSFGWRELLLEGTMTPGGVSVVEDRGNRPAGQGPGAGGVSRWNRINPEAYAAYKASLNPGNKVGAVLVAFWLTLVFLLVLGFGYSYFWVASTIIYLLLRRNVDSAELDEVYLEEDDQEGPWGAATPPAAVPATPAPAPARPATTLPIVDAPRAAPVTAVAPAPPPAPIPEPIVPPAPPATLTERVPESLEKAAEQNSPPPEQPPPLPPS